MATYACPVCGEEMDAAVYRAVLDGSAAVVRLTLGATVTLQPEPTLVELTCRNGHRAIYAWPPTGDAPEPKPPPSPNARLQTPEEADDLKELRDQTSPAISFKTLDDFGKWLFGGTAVVGSLAAGLGVSGFSPLDGPQRLVFACAVALVASSLCLVVWTLRPHSIDVNRWDLNDLNAHVSALLRERGRYLRRAGVVFAAALVLAGLIPLIPNHWRTHRHDGVTYAIKDGAVSVVAAFAHAQPRSIVRASFRVAGKPPVALPRASVLADGNGAARLTLTLSHSEGVRSVLVLRRWTSRGGGAEHQTCFLAIPQAHTTAAAHARGRAASRPAGASRAVSIEPVDPC